MPDLQPVILVPPEQLDEMLMEGQRKFPLETGGVLMGFVTAERTVVTSVVGPGPRAIHRRRSFTPDTEWQQERVADLYERSGRRDMYLGDWHTHPGGSTRASFTDWLAAWTIARSRDARCPNPVIVVLALEADGNLSIGAYRWTRRALRRISVEATAKARRRRST
jgi:integrative and conjugative element protein (TIGR02256 family)